MKYKSILWIATKIKWEIINNGLKGQCLSHRMKMDYILWAQRKTHGFSLKGSPYSKGRKKKKNHQCTTQSQEHNNLKQHNISLGDNVLHQSSCPGGRSLCGPAHTDNRSRSHCRGFLNSLPCPDEQAEHKDALHGKQRTILSMRMLSPVTGILPKQTQLVIQTMTDSRALGSSSQPACTASLASKKHISTSSSF